MLLSGIVVAVCRRRPSGVLTALAAIEAILLFAFPFASAPRGGKIDMELVKFLQRHAGLQRVATAYGNGLTPNFGSAFGIATINYDDLPVPDRTVRFVQRELDPKVLPIMFRPNILFRTRPRPNAATISWPAPPPTSGPVCATCWPTPSSSPSTWPSRRPAPARSRFWPANRSRLPPSAARHRGDRRHQRVDRHLWRHFRWNSAGEALPGGSVRGRRWTSRPRPTIGS